MRTILAVIFVVAMATGLQPCKHAASVRLTNLTYDGQIYHKGEYFVDSKTGEERGCICMKKPCAQKCCPFGQGYQHDKIHPNLGKCVPASQPFEVPVYKQRHTNKIEGFNATKKIHLLIGIAGCAAELDEARVYSPGMSDLIGMQRDGKLYVEIPNNIPNAIIYEPDKYCIDTFLDEEGKGVLNALICFASKPEQNNYALSSSCMLISCFFILLTVAVYAWIPELRNLHGMVLMAYLLSFFVGFLFLATMQILIMTQEITENICLVLTFIVYFSLLSAFFWLNVMCYDIWWTFSGKRAHGRSGTQHKRFVFYALYAFGVPTALTALLATLEFSESLPVQHPLLPMIRLQGCFLYGNSKLLYLYGPIVALCVANMTFFALTAFKIAKIKRETQVLQGRESSTHDQARKDTQRFTLYIKLFTVMGINWILEVVSSFYPDADVFWQFSDAYNVLVGLIIFIIFVCKKKTWKMIKKRYAQMRGDQLSRSQTTNSYSTRTHSASRDDLPMNSIKK
ncbi:G-protein coupled receptor Mth2-like isoform X2 [Helicoverpa zea]|uniref:G-protein coupled receptor Mth2-like isoform X2 n=1 Tax=Helicoverpa zea TaxID=7113 RepID=UPI001F56DDEF|nr:G-protein coupled receptor Mth2-like isoform X2 [Helicoverpa zea]